jgi:cytochrome c553
MPMISMTRAAAILSCMALSLCGLSASAQGDAAAGQAKSATCVACHGADGNSSNPEWPKIAGQHAGYTYKQLMDFKAQEQRDNAIMYGIVAGLSEQDMQDLAAYYATQSMSGGFVDESQVALGKRIYHGGNAKTGVPACMGCHGPAGLGDPLAGFPRLAGQHAQYTEAQLNAFRLESRWNDARRMMRNVAIRMTPAEMAAVSAYLSGLHAGD